MINFVVLVSSVAKGGGRVWLVAGLSKVVVNCLAMTEEVGCGM